MFMYKVYARHIEGIVTHIYSSCFEEYQEGDILIKEGYGDEFVHVGYYQLCDDHGCHNYRIVDGQMVEASAEDKEAEYNANKVDEVPSDVQILQQENKILKAQVEALTMTSEFHEELIAEMAMMIYA